MKNIEKKYLASLADGGLDADSADFAVGQNKVVNAENVRWGSTDNGVTQTVESVGGTRQISVAQPSLTFITIGVADDTANSRFIFFKYCTTGPWHRIVAYSYTGDTEYVVLLSSQIAGGLNFSKDYPIHSARVVDGLLYWTDNLNEPKKINIDSGIKLNNPSYVTDAEPYTTLPDSYEITLIRRPPTYAPSIAKAIDGTFDNNFIQFGSFQFAWQYIYFDNEVSVLSMFSVASKLNSPTEDYNYIRCVLNEDEVIPSTARILRLVAIPQNDNPSGVGFVVKTWDKLVDATPFTNHNNGSSQISYDYYGNVFGETVDSVTISTPFHTVPLRSKTLESARQRLYLGNNLNGYNTPGTTSMTLTPSTGNPGADQSVANIWFELDIYNPTPAQPVVYFGCYIVYLDTVSPAGYYYVAATRTEDTVNPVSPGTAPTSEAYSTLLYLGPAITDVVQYWRSTLDAESGYVGFYSYNYTFTGTNVTITGLANSLALSFKSGASFRGGIVFYDKALRKCGVVTNDGLEVEIANRDFDGTSVTTAVSWAVSNTNRLAEIPDWAYYYAPVRTLNLKTRFFLQTLVDVIKYVPFDANGAYAPASGVDTFSASGTAALGIDITPLFNTQLGYSYNQGDILVIVRDDDTIFTLPIVGQSGKWVFAKAEDIGTTTGEDYIVEIYTPYFSSDNEPYYEVGQLYPIEAAGSANRAYTTLSGVFTGDVFYLQRTFNSIDYSVEAMNPNDAYFQLWNTDAGRVNIVTLLGQVWQKNEIKWSGTYIQGTMNNNLSQFFAANAKQLPLECGPISKLQVTSKVNDELGVVMLSICEKETASLYLGEIQQYGSNTATNLVVSEEVIGTVNVLKGSYGTINPESVVEYRGLVFWFDAYNGRIIQYSSNGLYPISNYFMTRFWKQFALAYMGKTAAEIEALGSRPFVFTAVDPHHNELLITIPKVLSAPPKGYLPDIYTTQPVSAQGTVTITGLGEEGDNIKVQVIDPNYGPIILGQYTLTGAEPFQETIALNLYNSIVLNSYGYTASLNGAAITIIARDGLGTSLNLQGKLSVIITDAPDTLEINGTDQLLINSTDLVEI